MKRKLLILVMGILSCIGLNVTLPNAAKAENHKTVSALDSNAPLYLNLFSDSCSTNQGNTLNAHYSHYSHQSHYSHYSHRSHYSSSY